MLSFNYFVRQIFKQMVTLHRSGVHLPNGIFLTGDDWEYSTTFNFLTLSKDIL